VKALAVAARAFYRFFKYTLRGKKHPSKVQKQEENRAEDAE
jgi:hypothetical protein